MTLSIAIKSLLHIELSNEELMSRYVLSGDASLLAKLYDNCARDLYHFLLTLSEPELAADIAQKSWLRVMEKRHMYHSNGQFKAWLFTLARNLLMDEYRRTKRYPLLEACEVRDQGSQNKVDGTLLKAFSQALETLPFYQREAFMLYQEGFGVQDIALITGENQETIKSRLRYAKQQLRQQLGECCE
ncbi:sigma-70 family RNA polymerase sigma factor [Bowmanella yangjiangensis]|nr:sigma-70 family RNA polymerase sigma factor [Bowmanella yangjiangensis]